MVYLPELLFSHILKNYIPHIVFNRETRQRYLKKVLVNEIDLIFNQNNIKIFDKFNFRPIYGLDSVIDYISYKRRKIYD